MLIVLGLESDTQWDAVTTQLVASHERSHHPFIVLPSDLDYVQQLCLKAENPLNVYSMHDVIIMS